MSHNREPFPFNPLFFYLIYGAFRNDRRHFFPSSESDRRHPSSAAAMVPPTAYLMGPKKNSLFCGSTAKRMRSRSPE
jgi:hypothetical protein